jgi:hypothetical protein
VRALLLPGTAQRNVCATGVELMWTRYPMIAVMALALSGCMIESPAPLFSDADVTVNPVSGKLAMFRFEKNTWVREKDEIMLEPEGRHFIVRDGANTIALTFVALEENWWVVQAAEDKKPAQYALFHDGREHGLVYNLPCKDMKVTPAAQHLDFSNDDCTIKAGTDAKPFFANLVDVAGEKDMMLVPADRAVTVVPQ